MFTLIHVYSKIQQEVIMSNKVHNSFIKYSSCCNDMVKSLEEAVRYPRLYTMHWNL